MTPSKRTLRTLWSCFEQDDGARAAQKLCKLVRRGVTDPLELFADHPLADEWRDFALKSVHDFLRQRTGLVYVATNPVHAGVYKIGVTAFDVRKRMSSLKTAGVLGSFIEVGQERALDRFQAEARALREMAQRGERHKELFRTSYATALRCVDQGVSQDNAALIAAFPGVERILAGEAAQTGRLTPP